MRNHGPLGLQETGQGRRVSGCGWPCREGTRNECYRASRGIEFVDELQVQISCPEGAAACSLGLALFASPREPAPPRLQSPARGGGSSSFETNCCRNRL